MPNKVLALHTALADDLDRARKGAEQKLPGGAFVRCRKDSERRNTGREIVQHAFYGELSIEGVKNEV